MSKLAAKSKPPILASTRKKTARRQKVYRERQRAGKLCVTITIDAPMLDFLVRSRWLRADAYQAAEIGRAIEDLLALSAKI
jgi:hypothetical protein